MKNILIIVFLAITTFGFFYSFSKFVIVNARNPETKDCDTYFNHGQSVVQCLLFSLLTSINFHWGFNLFNKGNFCIPTVFVLMLNIILVFSISFLLRKIKDSLKIKNIHYFFLYEDLNDKLK